ncbi:MAG: YggS family pyridoxal phosphate-dependent enzyme [Bacillota bacterium]
MTEVDICGNIKRVRQLIAAAARKVGRDPATILLVAVTKGVEVPALRQALAAGVKDFGENRAQELLRKQRAFMPGEGIVWHFIGHLQRNKVRSILDKVFLIHSLDRWSLAVELDREAGRHDTTARVLVQVNVAGEATKFGLHPEEVYDFVTEVVKLRGLRVEGLMTIAPQVRDPEEVRPVFRRLREISRRLAHIPGASMRYLSMGMSQDYVVAIEEGANLLRVGTAIFGRRKGGWA